MENPVQSNPQAASASASTTVPDQEMPPAEGAALTNNRDRQSKIGGRKERRNEGREERGGESVKVWCTGGGRG